MGEPFNQPMRTYVAMILDRSGSMQHTKDITIRGFNEHVQTLIDKGTKGIGGETFASLVLFADEPHAEFFNAPVFAMRELTSESYQPNGSTALLDAVGYTIERLESETDLNDPNNAYLLFIVTDGEENASRHWSSEKLAAKIQELDKTGRWTVTYVGGKGTDLSKVQEMLCLDASNSSMDYDSMDDQCSLQQMASGTAALDMYYTQRSVGVTKAKGLYKQTTSDQTP